MDILQILKDARELLSDKNRWTKGSQARRRGVSCVAQHPLADCWCVSGAFQKVAPALALEAFNVLHGVLPPLGDDPFNLNRAMSPIMFNDSYASHEQILQAFDVAIAQLEDQ